MQPSQLTQIYSTEKQPATQELRAMHVFLYRTDVLAVAAQKQLKPMSGRAGDVAFV